MDDYALDACKMCIRDRIKSFADVKTGDYVVHESHGIGRFIGIEQLVVQGVKKDYLKVKYAGEDSLYIPVDQLGMLQKYVGGDGVTPRLNKLSGNEWKQTKAKARQAIDDMAVFPVYLPTYNKY